MSSPADSAAEAIRLRGVRFSWPGASDFRLAVPEFSVNTGEQVLLVGESGSGKSTLLSLICGVINADAGQIGIAGQDLTQLSSAARDRFRAENIGIIFQTFNLLPYAAPLDNVLLPLSFAPGRRRRLPDPVAEAMRLMTVLGLPERPLTRVAAGSLSVGQQQRVAVARAMIGAPPLIVADEPTSALDASAQASFLRLLFEQAAEAGSTLLMVTHDERLAEHFHRVVAIEEIAEVTRAETV